MKNVKNIILFLGLGTIFSVQPVLGGCSGVISDSGRVNYTFDTMSFLGSWLAAMACIYVIHEVVIKLANNQKDASKSKNTKVENSMFQLYKADDKKNRITFEDVVGAQEAKESLQDIIDYLKNPKEFEDLGIRMPAGVLLVGEPGNGKTLLARAMAGEAGVNFISASGSQFIERWIGLGAARVRELFDYAKKQEGPCIIFIDEIDSVGGKRNNLHDDTGEEARTINELLCQLDGFNQKEYPIIIMGATNNAQMLDDALIRPGRFDRIVKVANPTESDREKILELYLKNKKHLLTQEDIVQIAQEAVDFSGAQLENLVNQAAIVAARKRAKITKADFDKVIGLLVLDRKKTLENSPKDSPQDCQSNFKNILKEFYLEDLFKAFLKAE